MLRKIGLNRALESSTILESESDGNPVRAITADLFESSHIGSVPMRGEAFRKFEARDLSLLEQVTGFL